MDFRILGSLEVFDDGRLLDIGGGKQRAVLALLLIRANEVIASDELIDQLWPDQQPPSAAKSLQVHISRLRKALNGGAEGILMTRGHGYVLRVEPGQLDLDRFQRLIDDGRTSLAAGDPDTAEATLRQGLALWRGPPLVDFAYDSFAQEEIARLEELHLGAVEERIEADLALGSHDDVVQELDQLARRHPLRERPRSQLMLALYRAGRQAEALEVYRDARRTLADELGLEPSPNLQQLERAILTHDPVIQAPTHRSPRERTRRRGGLLIAAGALVLIAAATSVAAIELRSNEQTTALASLAADSVGVIDPDTNTIVGQIRVGSPTRIAVGRDAVWVVSEQDKTVTRIDPKAKTVLRTIPVGGPPIDVAVGADAVWLLVSGHPDQAQGIVAGHVARVDPSVHGVVERIPLGTGPFGFGAGGSLTAGDGDVWVANDEPTVAVSRIDAGTNSVNATLTVGGLSFPGYARVGGTATRIAVGDGAVWVATDVGVVRLNPRSKAVSATISLDAGIPAGLAVGERAVWLVTRPAFRCCPLAAIGTGTLTRIDPKTNSVEATLRLGGQPAGVAVDEGSVWIADSGTRSVIRVDAETNDVVERIKVGARPRGIAVGEGSVWVAVG